MGNMETSHLWKSLAKEKFAKIDEDFLSSFREPGNANNRLAAWDPFDKSMRYYKFLLFHQVRGKDKSFFDLYARIGETDLGNPVTIDGPSGIRINLDHFFSVEEFQFLDGAVDLSRVSHVVEIGAGFGRTAQAMIKLASTIRTYTIIDIPEVLSLSYSYLKRVLDDDEFAKLDFVDACALEDSFRIEPDLVINIDSFQEMTLKAIRYYFNRVVENSRYFFSKNAVGKYHPDSVGLYGSSDEQLQDVFSLGLSTDIINIFNEEALLRARARHVKQYCPSSSFSVIKQEPLGIFPYYHNVLYGKDESPERS